MFCIIYNGGKYMAKKSRHLPAHGTFRRSFRKLFVQRNHKDLLFVRLFKDKRELLQLYNALNGTQYENEQDLIIATIDDVIYMGLKNDCAFIIGNYLNLYEHQSTFCPNMPIRGLFYLSQIYQGYIARHGLNIYGSKQLSLPAPQYVVFYNGTEKRPEREELRLSSAFGTAGSCLELTVAVYNINYGYNQKIMEQCSTLAGYSFLVNKIRELQYQGMPLPAAIDAACLYCIDHDILKDFLSKHRNEVTKVLLTEYDAKKQRKMDMRDAREMGIEEGLVRGRVEGRMEGRGEGQAQILQLMARMKDAGEESRIPLLAEDPEFLRQMMEKYGCLK